MRPFPVYALGILLTVGIAGNVPAEASTSSQNRSQASASDFNLPIIMALLATPEDQVDFAQAKLILDRIVDPKIDMSATLRELDTWAAKVQARLPTNPTNRMKLDTLLSTLYQPGPWNDYRPFSYDFVTDPFGAKVHNKIVSNYLASRKGQCVSMPILVAILGQKLGLPVTLTTAPNHFLVKYGDEESGQWLNVEATTGGLAPDSYYERELRISPSATKNEIYLRPLTKREAVALMATIVLAGNDEKKNPAPNFKLADAILEVDPKNIIAMIYKANAFYLETERRFGRHYQRESDIPLEIRKDYFFFSQQNLAWAERAESLGWKEWGEEDRKNYLGMIQREKVKRGITK